jgi:sugar transferase EpsL
MTPRHKKADVFLKRGLDLSVSLAGLVFLLPFLPAVAWAIKRRSPGPVFFRQPRPGKHGRIFTILKFRTMSEERDERGRLVSDGERLTGFGKWLRRRSLDELPELWNVLKGEMSLVGPRPLMVQYLGRYNAEQARRHEVAPGLTGWAQVNGRNAITWEQKFKHDVWYVDHWSFWLDIKILGLTVVYVLRGSGISQPGYATAEEFMGPPPEGPPSGISP